MKILFFICVLCVSFLFSGCASFRMVKPDGTAISGSSVFKEINVSRREKTAAGECVETYKSKVDSESAGAAIGAAAGKALAP